MKFEDVKKTKYGLAYFVASCAMILLSIVVIIVLLIKHATWLMFVYLGLSLAYAVCILVLEILKPKEKKEVAKAPEAAKEPETHEELEEPEEPEEDEKGERKKELILFRLQKDSDVQIHLSYTHTMKLRVNYYHMDLNQVFLKKAIHSDYIENFMPRLQLLAKH